ncbi:hypothetical protein BLS_001209 [Venturia inaequalis]|uniref:PEBP-like protein n=1 Tax=Venturia inaequalis TaxID=5025 RepID=A0A8H3UXS2_VENIN|nr:hypothetical protein BLS_001209 [Venturia inaequalis]
MLSYTVAVQILLAVAGFTRAQSPPNVFPQVNNALIVQFGGEQVQAGSTLPSDVPQTLPTIGIQQQQVVQSSARYLMVMVDLDAATAGNTKNKRETNAAAAPAATDAAQQPDDLEHSGGRDTYLHAMIQDYQLTGGNPKFGNGASLLQTGTNGPLKWQAPNVQGQTHRYMMMLFDQPSGFVVPSGLQQKVQNRQNFDLRDFMLQANLPLPRYGTWFIINKDNGNGNGNGNGDGNGNGNGNGGLGISTQTSTYLTVSTAIVSASGINGGTSFSTATSSYFTTATSTLGAISSSQSISGSQLISGSQSTSLSTFIATTTFPNNGPTQTFLTISTAVVSGSAFSSGQSLITYTSTTTSPDGGPTQTFQTISTAFGQSKSNGGRGSSVFLTTTTLPNGPTQTFLTTSNLIGVNGGNTRFSSRPLFSTGFSGLRTSTSTGLATFLTFTTDGNGDPTAFTTRASTTATLTFTGVRSLTRSTYSTTSTGTAFFNGQVATFTSTGVVTSTAAATATGNGAERAAGGIDHFVQKAVVALCAAVLAYL